MKKYLNFYGYSDIEPYEVTKIISEKTAEVRAMKATLLNKNDLQFVPGGFCGTFVNQGDQKWMIESDESMPIIRCRFGKKGWKSEKGKHIECDEPKKFYDFNF